MKQIKVLCDYCNDYIEADEVSVGYKATGFLSRSPFMKFILACGHRQEVEYDSWRRNR